MGSAACAPNLGGNLGSRSQAHLKRWSAAGVAARMAMPMCEAVANMTRERCRCVRRKGFRFCVRHIRGADRKAAEEATRQRNLKIVERGGNQYQVERAERELAYDARRQLNRHWRKVDPRFPDVSTLELDDATEARVAAWLWKECRVDLAKEFPQTGHPPTALCKDVCRWTAYRALRNADAPEEFIAVQRGRVMRAVANDAKFWKKLASVPAWDSE